MSASSLQKDPELIAVLNTLAERLGRDSFLAVDNWPGDQQAVGVASPHNHDFLAYISVSSGAEEPYFVSLEFPPGGDWSDHPYTPGEDRSTCDLDALVQIVARHLLVAKSQPHLD